MDFVPENDLEKALVRAVTEAAARPEFYRQLLGSDLLILGSLDGSRLQIVSVQGKGTSMHPVFSSLTRLRAYIRDKQDYLELNGRSLFEMTKGATFVLNPNSPYGKELLPGEIEALLDPQAHVAKPITLDKATKVLIGQPSDYPHDLVDALKSEFAKRPDVLAAYLVQIAFEGRDEPPHPMIGVETTGDWNTVSALIGRTAAMVNPGMLLDAAPVDRNKPYDSFTRNFLQTTPFYTSAATRAKLS
jgi:SseB protein C-terminal domain/SseB protein N-terminal domain